jgi:hypothetical protein
MLGSGHLGSSGEKASKRYSHVMSILISSLKSYYLLLSQNLAQNRRRSFSSKFF